jgi:hypothetical protein
MERRFSAGRLVRVFACLSENVHALFLPVPQEVAWSCDFYVTICANPRRQNHFCRDPVGSAALSSARHYQNLSKWGIHVLLLIRDQ